MYKKSWNMKKLTGSKLGRDYVKAVYCHPAYLTSMQSTSSEMLDWKKHKLESRLLGEISITSDMQMTPLLWRNSKNRGVKDGRLKNNLVWLLLSLKPIAPSSFMWFA